MRKIAELPNAKLVDQLREFQHIEDSGDIYKQMFKLSVTPSIIYDLKMNIINANDSAIAEFGYSREELFKKKVSELCTSDELNYAEELDRHLESRRDVETLFKRKNGTVFYAETSPRKFLLGDQTVIQVFIQDISDRKQAEMELNRLNTNLEVLVKERTGQLEESLKNQELLTDEINHRVKNSLQLLSSIFYLYAEKESNSKIIEAINICRNNVHSLGFVYRNLLPSEGVTEVDFAEYLKNLCGHLKGSLSGGKNIDLQLNLESIQISIDQAINCGLIINEIITNAYKYAFPSGQNGTIIIELFKQNDKIELSISDNGIGFPEDFDINNTDSFGLNMIHTLVRQVHGDLTISGENGVSYKLTCGC